MTAATKTSPASESTKPKMRLPGRHPEDAGAGHAAPETQRIAARSPAILQLRELQAHRCACIRATTRNTNSVKAHIRRVLGFDTTLAEESRAKMVAASNRVYAAILKGKPLDDEREREAATACAPLVVTMKQGIESIEAYRANVEKRMGEIAATLPAADFAESVRGFSVMRLAVLIGEAGDLSDYANPGKLWKRMGVAPIECYKMEKKDGGEGYTKPKRRRSELFVIGDCLVKGNGDGPYRALYLERKEYEADRVKTKMHAHRRAQRYMEKRLLKDIWVAWNSDGERASPRLNPGSTLPAAVAA